MNQTGRLAPVSRKRDTYITSLKSRLRDYFKTITENYELILQRAKVCYGLRIDFLDGRTCK